MRNKPETDTFEGKYTSNPMSNSTQNEVLYTAWYCPNGGEKYKAHFVCHMATQKDIDRHLMECSLAKSQDKPYPGKFIPVERLPEASKTKDRALQEDWEKRYADMLKEFKRQTKIDMVADVLVMKSFISKEISYANQDGFDEGYGKGGMEGLKEGRADARKEVERKVKELSRYTDGVIAIKVVDGKTWIDKDKNQLVRLYDVLATLREEEKHG